MNSLPPSPPSPPATTQEHTPGDFSTPPSSAKSDSSGVSHHAAEHTTPSLPAQAAETERHPKGKRKRTTAQDKHILETAYRQDMKPDKAKRLAIVKQVSLNEKEVQIWFQNRRQNDRRKQRPLTSEEYMAITSGIMQVVSSDPPSHSSPRAAEDMGLSSSQSLPQPTPEERTTTPMSSPDLGPWLPGKSCGYPAESRPAAAQPADPAISQTPSPHDQGPGRALQLTQSFPSSVGFISNRWNARSSFSTPSSFTREDNDDSVRLDSFAPSSCPSTTATPLLPGIQHASSSQSQCRLSLSLDGKAEIRLGGSPSPPRASSSRLSDLAQLFGPGPDPFLRGSQRQGLRRTQSAYENVKLPPIRSLTDHTPIMTPSVPRLSRGRSRDVTAWERACDKENHEDELSIHAKHESRGSAVAAISLIRSTSNSSSILQPNNSKRNTPTSKPSARSGVKKSKFSRANSSVARMQSAITRDSPSLKPVELEPGREDGDPKKIKVSTLLAASGNESDKENWSPDEDGNPSVASAIRHAGRRPLPSAAPRNPRRTMGRVLDDKKGPAFLSGRASTAPSGRKAKGAIGGGQLEIFEDGGGGGGAESRGSTATTRDQDVERFMRGEEVSPSKKPDIDCIAGLLSLSQGRWR
ncbi:uncharacterized protein E0L32_003561 [Thyridium curvatum]|uniref:Homeobox domain-containing protein n=1 Tax=Thyridium curvatum TaxID=1093900 RepID=A0A507BJ46_9PEZI|nr:uncharacterized protein E0L32_003561 [Thyridium curvatum]TPX16620.1 hypothetical protein E0L32_003561 [Thyridium curvatum]